MAANIEGYAQILKGNFPPQLVVPELAKALTLEEALVVQEIHYWLQINSRDKKDGDDVSMYMTLNGWTNQFPYLSKSTIERTFKSLEQNGYVISEQRTRYKCDHTKHYTLDYVKLKTLLTLEKSNNQLTQCIEPQVRIQTSKAEVLDYAKFLKENFSSQLVIPELAEALGLNGAIVIQQIHYWLLKKEDIWTYNTFNDWTVQFPYWSLSTIKRIFKLLEQKGYIVSEKKNLYNFDHTKHYTLDYTKLEKILFEALEKRTETNLINQSKRRNRDRQFDPIKGHKMGYRDRQFDTSYSITKSTFTETNKTICLHDSTQTNFRQTEIKLSNSEKDICNEMIKIRNDIFINDSDKIVLTDSLTSKLVHLWESTLKKDMGKWETLCINVNSCPFLMGEKTKFKANFAFIIKPEIAEKILARGFDIGKRRLDIEVEKEKQQKLLELKSFEEQGVGADNVVWKKFLEILQQEYGHGVYRNLFTRLTLEGITNRIMTITVSHEFTKEVFDQKYLNTMKKLVSRVDDSIQDIVITVKQSISNVVAPRFKSIVGTYIEQDTNKNITKLKTTGNLEEERIIIEVKENPIDNFFIENQEAGEDTQVVLSSKKQLQSIMRKDITEQRIVNDNIYKVKPSWKRIIGSSKFLANEKVLESKESDYWNREGEAIQPRPYVPKVETCLRNNLCSENNF